MKIALYHGYELSGSGSNEYTRYLAVALKRLGHQVVLLCSEPTPDTYDFVERCYTFESPRRPILRFDRSRSDGAGLSLYQLPLASVQPVYVTDQQRSERARQFIDLSDGELDEYHRTMVQSVGAALEAEGPAVVHVNHLVWQPVVAAEVCGRLRIPFYIVPHGSSLEYVVKRDQRYRRMAGEAIKRADGLVWIAPNVRQRVLDQYPDLCQPIGQRSFTGGTGVDTHLFKPANGSGRSHSFERLIAEGAFEGKTTEQKIELRSRLDSGDLGAVGDYWDAYDHRKPDADLAAQLKCVAPGDDILLYVGALTWGKGVQSLLAALPEVLSRKPNVQLLIAGSGTFREALEALAFSIETGNEALFDALVAKGQGLDRDAPAGPLIDVRDYASTPKGRRTLFESGSRLAGKVHFLGRLDHSQLRRVFPYCHLAVFPSIVHEASPLVLAESLANGILPVAAYHSGLRDGLDALRDDLSPELFDRLRIDENLSMRVDSLSDNISWLLRQRRSKTLQANLRRIAEDRYDWTSIAKAIAGTADTITRRYRRRDVAHKAPAWEAIPSTVSG